MGDEHQLAPALVETRGPLQFGLLGPGPLDLRAFLCAAAAQGPGGGQADMEAPMIRTRSRGRSRLDQSDRGRGTDRGGFADGVVEFGRRGFVQEDDHAVLLSLVENVRGDQHALARRDALGSVDFYTHMILTCYSCGWGNGMASESRVTT
jgi:hypothetical protein